MAVRGGEQFAARGRIHKAPPQRSAQKSGGDVVPLKHSGVEVVSQALHERAPCHFVYQKPSLARRYAHDSDTHPVPLRGHPTTFHGSTQGHVGFPLSWLRVRGTVNNMSVRRAVVRIGRATLLD
eukprot:2123169-Prymnesium_polylepis.1